MRSLKIGILDAAAVVLVLVVILLPARGTNISPAQPPLAPEIAEDISEYQALLVANPADGAAAEELAETLVFAGYSDWALRVAGDATRDKSSPTLWRALRAVSTTHADRIEIKEALEWGHVALEACRKTDEQCPAHEEIRLQIYVEQLRAGLESGIDPKADPAGFRDAISQSGIRNIRLKPPKDVVEDK
jgi:hypothetical protein